MVNYACAFSQSEWGEYFEWIMKGIKGTDLVHFVLNANITLPQSLKNKELYTSCILYLSYLYPSFGILFPSWIYSYKVFQWYLGHSTKRKENRTYIHVTRLLAVRFSLLCFGMLHTTPWEGCMNHDLATEGERQLRAGKSAERTKRNFRCPICCSAIDHASCLICARRRQLTFPFSC